MNNKLYDTLEVDRSATIEEIKKNYKILAKKYHPDRNSNDPTCKQKFQEIVHAYEVLSNSEKRQLYDNFGEQGLQGLDSQDNEDPMADLFRHMNMNMNMNQNRNQTARMEHVIDLSTYFKNTSVKIEIPRQVKCDICDATGFVDKTHHHCKKCNGNGVVNIVKQIAPGFVQQIQQPCPLCMGLKNDTTLKDLQCKDCTGSGFKSINEKVEVNIPQNIIDQPVTIVENKGPLCNNRYIDIAVIFKLKLETNFKITSDKKLLYTMNVTLADTICGFSKTFMHPNGTAVSICSDEGSVIDPNNIYKIEKLGFNNKSFMYLAFVVEYPKHIKINNTTGSTGKKSLSYSTLREAFGQPVVKQTIKDKVKTVNLNKLSFVNNSDNNNSDSDNEQEFINGNQQTCNQQ